MTTSKDDCASPAHGDMGAARAAARDYTDAVLRLPNVIGCGVARRMVGGRETEEWCFSVFVSRKVRAAHLRADEMVPRELTTAEGTVRTDVVERAQPVFLVDTSMYRPLRGGCQISTQAGNGTLGAIVYDGTDWAPVLLTCNHCLTQLGQRDAIPANPSVRQPATIILPFSPSPANPSPVVAGPIIGTTKRIVPWLPPPLGQTYAASLEARVDAGIASMTVDAQFRIIGLGKHPYVILPPYEGLEVTKRGHMTELTQGATVKAVDVSITIKDKDGRYVRIGGVDSGFAMKASAGTVFAAPGDSGSLVLDADRGAARGMIFAGDLGPGGWVYACELGAIFAMLELETPCTGGLHGLVQRAVLRRHSEWMVAGGGKKSLVGMMVRNIDRFRDHYLSDFADGRVSGAFGGMLQHLATELAEAVHCDEDFAGLLDRAFGDWLVQPTIYDMLEYRLPADFDDRVRAAFGRLHERSPEACGVDWLPRALADAGGRTMREWLARKAPAERPAAAAPARPARRRKEPPRAS